MNIDLAGFLVAALVAILGVLGSWWQRKNTIRAEERAIKAETRAIKAEKTAEMAVNREQLHMLYGGYEIANEATLNFPGLLRSIHGVSKEEAKDDEELRNIAYLSILIDSFQKITGNVNGEYNFKIIGEHSFLNIICSTKENQKRWGILKRIYYGQIDKEFINFIDELFDIEIKHNKTFQQMQKTHSYT